MYPTCVGMNRMPITCQTLLSNVPHMRGDEPGIVMADFVYLGMYPTCVGMNRSYLFAVFSICYVPHMRGDEPYLITVINT